MLRRIFAEFVSGKGAAWIVLFWMMLAGAAIRVAAAPQSPAEIVAQLQQTIIEAWRSDASFESRFQMLAPAIVASHDLTTMVRFALGDHWQELSSAQRERFLATFRRLTIATYADRFTQYDGERFVRSGERKLAQDKYLVRTHLIASDGTRIQLDYLLHKQNGEWQIINVLAEGISELAIKRSQYTAYIRDHGFAALIEELQRKIADMAGEPNANAASSAGRATGTGRATSA